MFYKRTIKDYTVGNDHRILFEMKLTTPHSKVWAEKKRPLVNCSITITYQRIHIVSSRIMKQYTRLIPVVWVKAGGSLGHLGIWQALVS